MFSEDPVAPVSHSDMEGEKTKMPEDMSGGGVGVRDFALKDIALRLRRAKRCLLLSAASTERPSSSSDSFHTLFMHLSDLDMDLSSALVASSSTGSSSSSEEMFPSSRPRPRDGSVTSSGSK